MSTPSMYIDFDLPETPTDEPVQLFYQGKFIGYVTDFSMSRPAVEAPTVDGIVREYKPGREVTITLTYETPPAKEEGK